MSHFHSTRLAAGILLAILCTSLRGQSQPVEPGAQSYLLFLQSRAIGREDIAVVRQADGWMVRGSNRLGPPLDAVTRAAEIHYDAEWRPKRLAIEGTSRGQEISLKTTFAGGNATNEISIAGRASTKVDPVALDTIALPNAFLGSYAALAHRLVGQAAGTTFRGYIAPQGEVPITLDAVFAERIETPQRAIAATRYVLSVVNPIGELQMHLWTDADGTLLRLSVPLQALELAREDVASAGARMTSFSLPNDEAVRIPSVGFTLAGSITKPSGVTGPLPSVVLIGGTGPVDRDGTQFGIPVMGQMAGALAEAGFLVVRFDKRGVGQSGGRAEGATIADYVEDVRGVIRWLERRKDVDKRRIGLVGHSEGSWVALSTAARERRVAALALMSGASTRGADVVLEQQQRLLEKMKTPDAQRQAKVQLQERINAAVLGQGSWDGIPDPLRNAADTPWFHSYLSFDPARVMKDVRQPMLIVHGELDTQVPPHHAERLAELARARKGPPIVDVIKPPGVNHLLVPAKTGELDEYSSLTDKHVSTAVTAAVAAWMAKTLR